MRANVIVTRLARSWRNFCAFSVSNGAGGAVNKTQVHSLARRTVYVCFDVDTAGRKGAQKAAVRLKEAGCTVAVLEPQVDAGKDYCDWGDRAAAILRHAVKEAVLDVPAVQAFPHKNMDAFKGALKELGKKYRYNIRAEALQIREGRGPWRTLSDSKAEALKERIEQDCKYEAVSGPKPLNFGR